VEGGATFMKHFIGGASYKSLETSGLEEEAFASAGDRTPIARTSSL
jgi:hypothetical protein